MTQLQPLYRRFHEAIQLTDADENATLREKRDLVLSRLRASAPQSFTTFNQGSYAMGTGVIPTNGDYDIDVGVVFTGITRPDPKTVKAWVYDAVAPHTTRVEWRRPCVTVYWQKAGEPLYHVDLAVYWQDPYTQSLHLAMGKQHSSAELTDWQQADPKGLIAAVKAYGNDAQRAQLRRVIRYLKRWRDVHFPTEGNAAPVGIGLTVAALQWFQPTAALAWDQRESLADDHTALHGFVRSLWRQGPRIRARLPVAPWSDPFERMTDQQMQDFRVRLDRLDDWLMAASQGDVSALAKAFGSDFPQR